MKNIHLLPTDKPSRLFNDGIDLYLDDLMDRQGHPVTSYNIYITSDENIKEGDWVFNFEYNYIVRYDSKKHDDKFWYKKIILTTDKSLDCVQPIDDEFLEWFVKNPSCESIYVEKLYKNGYGNWYKNDSHFIPSETKYKIIIPKEEPKLELPQLGTKEFVNMCESIFGGKPKQETNLSKHLDSYPEYPGPRRSAIVSKQETLEEAAERIAKEHCSIRVNPNTTEFQVQQFIIKGAYWQAQRMYSEEEVISLIQFLSMNENFMDYTSVSKDAAKYYLEQFKKK